MYRKKIMQLFRMLRTFTCRESGVSLVETVVALAILGTIAVIFLTGLVTISKAAYTADERATAWSLAQTQMEWAQKADYLDSPTQYDSAPLPDSKDYINYSSTITAEPLNYNDDGIQKIIVTVTHDGNVVITLEGYKVDR